MTRVVFEVTLNGGVRWWIVRSPENVAVLIRKHAEHGYPYIQEAEPREWGDDDFSGWYIRVAPPSLTYPADQVGEPG